MGGAYERVRVWGACESAGGAGARLPTWVLHKNAPPIHPDHPTTRPSSRTHTLADVISGQVVAELEGYHRECVRDCSWHPQLPLMATGERAAVHAHARSMRLHWQGLAKAACEACRGC